MSVASVTVTKCVVARMSVVTGAVTVNFTVNVTRCAIASMSALSYPRTCGP